MVRSGAITCVARPHASSSGGSTTDRLAPIGTVLRTTTRGSGPHQRAMARAAAARKVRLGLWLVGSIGVDTEITAASRPVRGNWVPMKMRSPNQFGEHVVHPGLEDVRPTARQRLDHLGLVVHAVHGVPGAGEGSGE